MSRRALEMRLRDYTDRRGENECWPWIGTLTPGGYGHIRLDAPSRRKGLAHRLVYEQACGPIPAGMQIDHMCHDSDCPGGPTCPHRRCVNPAHLRLSTPAANLRRSSAAKLTQEAVNEMRHELERGVRYRELAERYGVTVSSISRVASGECWTEGGPRRRLTRRINAPVLIAQLMAAIRSGDADADLLERAADYLGMEREERWW